jgi:hypothetical protein
LEGFLINYDIDYGNILSELSDLNIERIIEVFFEKLPNLWSEKYIEMTPTTTNILQFNDSGFEYMFDLSSELIARGIVPNDQAVEDRLVVVFGRSRPRYIKRDKSRMRGFLGPSSEVFGDNYDKGHFIGHAIGGNLDVNLFPQRKDINQGLSPRGKVFRRMEKHCFENPGTFCFHRPIYCDRSWHPCIIEFGLLTKEKSFWIERFEN